jgi:hypothetical protein
MYPVFNLGLGGKIGSGEQYVPFVSSRDTIRALIHVLETPALEGPVNICAPGGVPNSEFTRAMGTVLRRPTILPLPAFVVSLLFGEMEKDMLLGGTRANPTKLLESGFQFEHVDAEGAIRRGELINQHRDRHHHYLRSCKAALTIVTQPARAAFAVAARFLVRARNRVQICEPRSTKVYHVANT